MAEEAVVIKLRAEIKDVKKSLDALNKKITKSTKKMSSDFKAVGKDIFKNIATALSIKTLGQGIKNLSEMAAKAEGVSDSFDRMVESTGATADVFKKELREASRGTISDLQLMTKTNQAMILLGKESVKDIPKLIKIARASAKATGESVEFLFDSIVLGLGRSSKMILDNLGIVFSAEKANEKFALSLGTTAAKLTEAQKKQAFFNATMKAGDKIIDQVGDATDLAGDAQARMNATLENNSLELGKVLLPRWQRFVTLIGDTVNAGSFLIEWVDVAIKAVETLGVQAGAVFFAIISAIRFAVSSVKAFAIAIKEAITKGPEEAMANFLRRSKQAGDLFAIEQKNINKDLADEILKIWDDTEKDKTKSTKSGVRERTEAAIEAANRLKQIGKSEIDFFKEKARVTVTTMQALTTRLSAITEEFVQKAGETNDEFVQRVKDQQALVKEKAQSTFDAIQEFATGASNVFAENFSLWTQQMIDGTFDIGKAFERLAKSMLKFLLQAIGKGLIQQGAAKLAEAIAASLGIVTAVAAPGLFAGAAKLTAVGGVILGLASAIKLARGGLVTGPTNAIVGEAGPELVIPLDKLKGFTGGLDLRGASFAFSFPGITREQDLNSGRFAQTAARQFAQSIQGHDQRTGVKAARRV